jgi:hypothetical protein
VNRSDLTAAEQANVKTALAFLRARCVLRPLAKALRVSPKTLRMVPSPAVAFRVARLAAVGVDDVLAGRFPLPGCAHCGLRKEDEAAE